MRSRSFWAVLSAMLAVAVVRGQEKPDKVGPSAKPDTNAVEIRFADDSTVKMSLQTASIEVVTPEILEGREKARIAAELAAEREAKRLADAEVAAQEQAAARAAAQEARGDEPPRLGVLGREQEKILSWAHFTYEVPCLSFALEQRLSSELMRS